MAMIEKVPLLSVLVPIYRFDVRRLAAALAAEITAAGIHEDIELLFLDDGSPDPKLRDANREAIAGLSVSMNVSCLDGPTNRGRAQARNELISRARGRFLLFLDCDVLPDEQDFLRKYLHYARTSAFDVVCGGISYRQIGAVLPEKRFHLALSTRTDVKTARERNLEPWVHVHTSNVMVTRECAKLSLFDPRFLKYGYEDTEWAIRLCQSFRVTHIDNTITHLGLISKGALYQRMRDSIQNLALLCQTHPQVTQHRLVSRLARVMDFLPTKLLLWIDRAVRSVFFLSKVAWVEYLVFQFSKAVALALFSRNGLLVQAKGAGI